MMAVASASRKNGSRNACCSASRQGFQSAVPASEQCTTCLATTCGRQRCATRASVTRSGHRAKCTSSRHEGNTIDLLQCCFSAFDRIERSLAQQSRTVAARRLLDGLYRLPCCDHLPDVVIEIENFSDRLAAFVA